MIKNGSKGEEVQRWQEFLSSLGLLRGGAAAVDGVFGPQTEGATKTFQIDAHLEADGVVGADTFQAAIARGWRPFLGEYLWVPARWFTPTEGREITLIVIHTMEVAETSTSARAVARGFARRPKDRAASAHYCIDAMEIVQCVRDQDVAWHAGGANRRSLGIEHAGYARQSEAEWADPYSTRMLELSASLVARRCHEHGIPVRRLNSAELKAGEKGIAGHADCVEAFGGSHYDPGPHFPFDAYLKMVRAVTPVQEPEVLG